MSWQQYVAATTGLGFNKVTIIARANYQTLGYTAQTDIATAWKDGDVQVHSIYIYAFCLEKKINKYIVYRIC